MQAYSVPCWWVGWLLWRAGCISQDTYLLYLIFHRGDFSVCLADFCDILRCSAQVKAKASQFFCLPKLLCPWSSHRLRLQLCSLDCAFTQNHLQRQSSRRRPWPARQPPGSNSHQVFTARKRQIQKQRERQRDRETETAVGILKMINFEGGPRSQ